MKYFFIVKLLIVFLFVPVVSVQAEPRLQLKAQALINAYPTQLDRFDGTYLIWKDGTKMRFDDGRTKSFRQLLETPDIEDMFYAPYVFGGGDIKPGYQQDPGRVRNQAFFNKLYGDCLAPATCRKGDRVRCRPKGSIRRIAWLGSLGGKTLNATDHLDIDHKLSSISRELSRLGRYREFLIPSAGGYAPRCIAGTSRISVHSYGAAVDIRYGAHRYWKHSRKKQGEACRNRGYPVRGCYVYTNDIPASIVRIFEKYGFIWGGNWYHYDAFHFEYRPEFLELKKLMQKKCGGLDVPDVPGKRHDQDESIPDSEKQSPGDKDRSMNKAMNDISQKAQNCHSLWFARNQIFNRKGYCFSSKKAAEIFDNSDCTTRSPVLSVAEQARVQQIKSAEVDLGCR